MLQKPSEPHGAPKPPPPAEGHSYPTRGESWRWAHGGGEPATARSDLWLRALLSRIFAALFLIGMAGFSLLAAVAGPGTQPGRTAFSVVAAICTVFFGVAVVDLIVIRRRRNELHRWARPR